MPPGAVLTIVDIHDRGQKSHGKRNLEREGDDIDPKTRRARTRAAFVRA